MIGPRDEDILAIVGEFPDGVATYVIHNALENACADFRCLRPSGGSPVVRRFAEDTDVSVGRSQGEVKDRLRAAGADQIAIFESTLAGAVAFTLAGRMYRLEVPRTSKTMAVARGLKSPDQEERRAWRLLLLLVKAKLEAVREGATTIEREFLADMLLPDGSTVLQRAAAELAIAYEKGEMPTTLLLAGPRQ